MFTVLNRPKLFISTGDANFGDLFGGYETESHGIRLLHDECGTLGASILIAGHAGTGKTTLAYQLCVQSVLRNNWLAMKWQEGHPQIWPRNGLGLICTLDQNPNEIKELLSELDERCIDQVFTLDVHTRKGCADKHKLAQAIAPFVGSCRFVIAPFEYSHKVTEIRSIISDTVEAINNAAAVALRNDEAVVKVVVIDSINSTVRRNSDGNYTQDFRELLQMGREFNPNAKSPEARHRFSTIVTFELDPECVDPPEEHLPQCVIHLRRERDSRGLRTIEVRKARHQSHFLGSHTARIEKNGLFVFPSVAARAREIPVIRKQAKRPVASQAEILEFGVREIDDVFAKEHLKGKEIRKGSTTLLWGQPGSGKSALLIKFMVQQWRTAPICNSSVLLVTTKIPPWKVLADLEAEVKRDEVLGSELQSRKDIEDRYRVIDARNSYRSHDMTFANVIDAVRNQNDLGRPVERAVVFGLGLIDETPQIRDEQWNFLSSLVEFFLRNSISTLLVDWPIEGRSDNEPRSPRAAKLCGNELTTKYSRRDDGTAVYEVLVARGNYGSVMEHADGIPARELEV